ncbi:MAG: hypothetical protein HY600_03925, partial [Candidatus Omnitrophica bacterium]|nr:hypothetical protein [Candidatus Omnitrophota bacterium]
MLPLHGRPLGFPTAALGARPFRFSRGTFCFAPTTLLAGSLGLTGAVLLALAFARLTGPTFLGCAFLRPLALTALHATFGGATLHRLATLPLRTTAFRSFAALALRAATFLGCAFLRPLALTALHATFGGA